jgi:hypothetical protein
MPKFRKKPVIVEAVQIKESNQDEIINFLGKSKYHIEQLPFDGQYVVYIETLEGTTIGALTDWIIRGVAGEYYPCKTDIFEQTYEEVIDE